MTDLLSNKLPYELVDIIKLYTGEACWIKGKFVLIHRFCKDDPRYAMLRNKPRIKQLRTNSYPVTMKGCTWFKYPTGKFVVIFVGYTNAWNGHHYINDHMWEMSYNKTVTLLQIR
jgi:hypothetical protein